MKSYLQQSKRIFYKKALVLLFTFFIILNINAQIFYCSKDVHITIDRHTTLYVADSGTIDQSRIDRFIGKTENTDKNKNLASAGKNAKSDPKKNEKSSLSGKIKEKISSRPNKKPVEFVKCPTDNFFFEGQKVIAVSGFVNTLQYNFKIWVENVGFNLAYTGLLYNNKETVNSSPEFFKDYNLLNHITRPPPYYFYFV